MWSIVSGLWAQVSSSSLDSLVAPLASLGIGGLVAGPVALNNRSLRADLKDRDAKVDARDAAIAKMQQAAVDREKELSGATLAQVVQSVSAIREVQAALVNTATRPAVDLDDLVARLAREYPPPSPPLARKGQRDQT